MVRARTLSPTKEGFLQSEPQSGARVEANGGRLGQLRASNDAKSQERKSPEKQQEVPTTHLNNPMGALDELLADAKLKPWERATSQPTNEPERLTFLAQEIYEKNSVRFRTE